MGSAESSSGKGKTIVVTGAASGIAKATVVELLQRNWKVFALDVNESGLAALSAEVSADKKLDKTLLKTYVCDLADQDAIAKTCKDINAEVAGLENGLNALVNCAGLAFLSPVMAIEWRLIELQIKVNTLAPMLLTRLLFDNLIKGEGGNLVNVSSVGGLEAWPFQGAYSVSKFGLEGFADTLRKELIAANLSQKLRISTVNPGAVDTPMARTIMGYASKWLDANRDSKSIWYSTMEGIYSRMKKVDMSKGEYPYSVPKSWAVLQPQCVAKKIVAAASCKHPRYRYLVMAPVFRVLWFMMSKTPTYISDRVSAKAA